MQLMQNLRLRALVPGGFAPFLFGIVMVASSCAPHRDQVEKRISMLNDEIVRLRSHGDRLEERISVLEAGQPHAKSVQGQSSPDNSRAPNVIERPPLKVVRLVPGSEGAAPQITPCDAQEGGLSCENQQ